MSGGLPEGDDVGGDEADYGQEDLAGGSGGGAAMGGLDPNV